MPRPARNKKKTEETANQAEEEAASEVTTTDEKTNDLKQQLEDQAAMKEALDDLKKKEEELDELRQQLKSANQKVEDVSVGNVDFSERPKAGEFHYFSVRFHPMRNEHDTVEASAAVNGDWINWPRGVETVLRSDYREVLEHAFHPKFKVLPGQARKHIGGIQIYTFDILKKISKAEYTTKLGEGNERQKEAIQKGETEG